jgi:hypothetical protein
VIGKAARPRVFKNVAIDRLPATWKSNRKAWMTGDIMSEWLLQLDRKMGIQKRKILLFLDNAGSHPRVLKLKNVKVIFLPPNTTSVCQPLDQGIIKNFKFYYRDLILRDVLSKIEGVKSATELSKKIDVLEALYFIKTSWNKVSPSTIKNCFKKAGFHKGYSNLTDYDPEDDIPSSTLSDLLKRVRELEPSADQNLEDFIIVDENVQTEEDNVDIQNLTIEAENNDDEENDNDSEEETQEVLQNSDLINSYEALGLTAKLKQFARNDFIAFQYVKNLETHFQDCLVKEKKTRMRQSRIFSFITFTS